MELSERVELHRLLTEWTAEYGCEEMAAALVAAIEEAAHPTRARPKSKPLPPAKTATSETRGDG